MRSTVLSLHVQLAFLGVCIEKDKGFYYIFNFKLTCFDTKKSVNRLIVCKLNEFRQNVSKQNVGSKMSEANTFVDKMRVN
jgi:hypothetical protein